MTQRSVDAKTIGGGRVSRTITSAQFVAFLRRVVRASARRVAEGDGPELLELFAVREDLDDAICTAIEGQLAIGKSWAQVAAGMNMTRQGAQQWYSRRRRDSERMPA